MKGMVQTSCEVHLAPLTRQHDWQTQGGDLLFGRSNSPGEHLLPFEEDTLSTDIVELQRGEIGKESLPSRRASQGV
jgi:hypothetical protein